MEEALACEICGQQDGMYTETDIRTHMRLEHEETGPSCPLCDLCELTLEELQLHINTAHVDILSPATVKSTPKADWTLASVGDEMTNANIDQSRSEPEKSKFSNSCAENTREGSLTHSASGVYNKSKPNRSRFKMAAIFPDSEGKTNSALSQDSSQQKSQAIELLDLQSKQNQDDTSESSSDIEYPLQLRSPCNNNNIYFTNQSADMSLSNSTQRKSMNVSSDDSLEMVSFALDGSMLLVSDTEDECASIPGSTDSDSPSKKRSRNSTSSSRSSHPEQDRENKPQRGPLRKLLASLTPKKMAAKNAVRDSLSGIWFDSDDAIHDASNVQGPVGPSITEWGDNTDMPECPFCDVCGLHPKAMTQHIEDEHADLLSPTETSCPNGVNQKASANPKPTLLSLSQSAKNVESAILCPVCGYGSYDVDFLTKHINTEHPEIGSHNQSEDHSANAIDNESHEQLNGTATGQSTSNSSCPVCGLKGLDQADLAAHVEGHFIEDPSHKRGSICNGDDKLARQLAEQEKQLQERKEKEEFKRLQDQYGMNGSGGYQHQSEAVLEKAVARGQMSITDFHQQKGRIRQIVATGIDDGRSRTEGLITQIEAFYSKDNRNVSYARVCSDMDHFGGTPGDRGFGCGYRNLQMLLSGMLRDLTYKNTVFNGRDSIPAIDKLQQLIETAWEQGWDPQGREQLGGRVCNTRKWIGATEIVALLSYLKTKCLLVDFHKPTGPNGTHPRMFEWVKNYFGQPGARLFNRGNQIKSSKISLYLQHQGHSRTIIGYEVLKDNSIRLLIFDPSMPHKDIQSLKKGELTAQTMRPIRKSLAQMKAKQYQIVGVQGIYNSEREHQQSKLIHSQRVP